MLSAEGIIIITGIIIVIIIVIILVIILVIIGCAPGLRHLPFLSAH